MRIINGEIIVDSVEKLCGDANYYLGEDIINHFDTLLKKEESSNGIEVLNQLKENALISKNENKPICQDTGMAIVFVEIGEDIFIEGNIESLINEGIRRGYKKYYLRKSIVEDPIFRKNTNDNTPGIIHIKFVKGDKLKITVVPKGFGSENMSQIKMMAPSDGIQGIKNFVVKTVEQAGPNPCPPIIVGVGIGGNFEYSAYLSKKALLRKIGERNENSFYSDLEIELLNSINNLGIGPQGYGGRTTADRKSVV